MSTDPFDSDGFIPSRGENYKKRGSREITEAELYEMQKHLVEHTKIKATISTLMEQQTEYSASMVSIRKAVEDVNRRLASGDIVLARVTDQLDRLKQHDKEIRSLNSSLLDMQRDIGDSGKEASDIKNTMKSHIIKEEAALMRLQEAVAHLRKEGETKSAIHPILATVIATVLGAIASSATLGALWASFQREAAQEQSHTPHEKSPSP